MFMLSKSIIKIWLLVFSTVSIIYTVSCNVALENITAEEVGSVTDIALSNRGGNTMRLSWNLDSVIPADSFLVEYLIRSQQLIRFKRNINAISSSVSSSYEELDWTNSVAVEETVNKNEEDKYTVDISGLDYKNTYVFRVRGVREEVQGFNSYFEKKADDWKQVASISISYDDITMNTNEDNNISVFPTINPEEVKGIFSFTNEEVVGGIGINSNTGEISVKGTVTAGQQKVGVRFEGIGDYVGEVVTELLLTVNPVSFGKFTGINLVF